ncbi:MAG: hypothetical protein R3C27_09635 [Hyphomonadaceae bacterium]
MTRFFLLALAVWACTPSPLVVSLRQCIATTSVINPTLSDTEQDEAALIERAKAQFTRADRTPLEDCCDVVWQRTDEFTTEAAMAEMNDPSRRSHRNAIAAGLDSYPVVRIRSRDTAGYEQVDAFQFDRCGNNLHF